MAGTKAKLAAQIAIANPTLSYREVVERAGYGPSLAQSTTHVTKTKTWQDIMNKHLKDQNLAKKHEEQLNASKLSKLYFEIDDTKEKIEEICKELGVKLLYTKLNKELTGQTAYVKAPDFFFRDLALDKAYKLKKRYSDTAVNNAFFVSLSQNAAGKYGIVASDSPEIERHNEKQG